MCEHLTVCSTERRYSTIPTHDNKYDTFILPDNGWRVYRLFRNTYDREPQRMRFLLFRLILPGTLAIWTVWYKYTRTQYTALYVNWLRLRYSPSAIGAAEKKNIPEYAAAVECERRVSRNGKGK